VKAIQYKEYIDGRPGTIVVELRIGADGKGAATPPTVDARDRRIGAMGERR
jgi:hypothetical protein